MDPLWIAGHSPDDSAAIDADDLAVVFADDEQVVERRVAPDIGDARLEESTGLLVARGRKQDLGHTVVDKQTPERVGGEDLRLAVLAWQDEHHHRPRGRAIGVVLERLVEDCSLPVLEVEDLAGETTDRMLKIVVAKVGEVAAICADDLALDRHRAHDAPPPSSARSFAWDDDFLMPPSDGDPFGRPGALAGCAVLAARGLARYGRPTGRALCDARRAS